MARSIANFAVAPRVFTVVSPPKNVILFHFSSGTWTNQLICIAAVIRRSRARVTFVRPLSPKYRIDFEKGSWCLKTSEIHDGNLESAIDVWSHVESTQVGLKLARKNRLCRARVIGLHLEISRWRSGGVTQATLDAIGGVTGIYGQPSRHAPRKRRDNVTTRTRWT